MMKVKPFVLMGRTQCDALNTSFVSDMEAWAHDWFGEAPPLQVRSAPISKTFDTFHNLCGVRFARVPAEQWAVCLVDDTQWARLGSMLLADKEPPQDLSAESVLHGLVRICLQDMACRLLPLPGSACEVTYDTVDALLPDDAFAPGNEALYLSIDLQGTTLIFWLPVVSVLQRIAGELPEASPTTGPLVKPLEAIGHQKLSFEIHLGSAELTLGAISELRMGDVLRLDKDLQDPLSLVFDKSSLCYDGYLGKQDGCFAFLIDGIHGRIS